MNVNENKRLSNINEHQILFNFTLKTQLKAKAQALLIYGFYSDFLTHWLVTFSRIIFFF